ncbi:MAG TPA: hypothetical protein VGY48_20800 [Vicinamibacterales bacterium]|jgi:hypothetical protein|nr:hypothetical protein [Vicinamibacterales bacterium]
MKALSARCVALLCTVACATVAIVTLGGSTDRRVRTEDRNADGRPDVWRQYDLGGQLAEVAIDTNFDGRSDIQEYYGRGGLVRRESDRNFDDRVDLIEEFDEATHEQIKSVVDLDYDGSADLLVLFRDGRPVFAQRAGPRAIQLPQPSESAPHDSERADRRAADPLAGLADPFRGRAAVRGAAAADANAIGDECLGPSTSGLPVAGVETVDPRACSTALVFGDVHAAAHTSLLPRSPRGPPLT